MSEHLRAGARWFVLNVPLGGELSLVDRFLTLLLVREWLMTRLTGSGKVER